MADARSDLRNRLDTLLRSNLDRGALLRELETLVQERAFRDLAGVWAPALYERDGRFFETFLLRHLDGRHHAEVIHALLPGVEAAEHDSLFQGLYRKVAREEEWNKELLALAQAQESDERVLRALERREMRQRWFALSEEAALALYRRNPALFREFVRDHVRREWGTKRQQFEQLRAEAQRQGDGDFYWFLFREFADKQAWTQELRRLLLQNVPANQIVEELRKRHSAYIWDVDAGILVDFVEKYGSSVLPYVEQNVRWIARSAGKRFLRAVERLGDETLYWRSFFVAATSPQWNDALRDLLKRDLPEEQFLHELQRRTPPPEPRWNWWSLADDVALALYRRDPARFRPYLERFVQEAGVELFRAAERAGDDEFLDFLAFRLLRQLSSLAYRVFPRWGAKPDQAARQQWEGFTQLLTGRFDRLYAQSPETYVRHAANILSRFSAYGVWSFNRDRQHNPAFAYLVERHHEVWRRMPEAMRELLESPNIYVQIIGLQMLDGGGVETAQRVIENLPLLRALLLGRAKRNTKKKTLQCLEHAARQGPEFAAVILPLLEEAMDFRGKRAIDERILVSFVRVRRQTAASVTY